MKAVTRVMRRDREEPEIEKVFPEVFPEVGSGGGL